MDNQSPKMLSDEWNSTLYQEKHQFVWQYGTDLLALLNPQQGDRILDLGCGTGQLSQKIAESGANVVGIDSSAEMIAQARQNYPNLDFRVADAANFSLDMKFDSVFSNATLHWIKSPQAVITSIKNALKPGGLFLAEFGGKGNIESITTTIESILKEGNYSQPLTAHPWYFPSMGKYVLLLEEQGFQVNYATLFERPTPLTDGELGIQNWLKMFTQNWLTNFSEAEKQDIYQNAEERLRSLLYRENTWFADYVRLRIMAKLSI